MCTDAKETPQLFRIFLIACFSSDLFDPLVVTLYLCFLFFIRSHVLVQCFAIHRIQFELFQPSDMLDGPLSTNILMSMPKNKRVDLLLQLFLCQLMIIPHPQIFLNSIILTSWNIDWMVSAIAQALSDQTCITLICFNALSLLCEHCSRGQDDAFKSGVGKLVVQRIPKASCLVTAFNRILIIKTEFHLQRFNEVEDLFVVWGDLYFPEDSVFRPDSGFHCA